MNPMQRLQAAIEKLERLRECSMPGPWHAGVNDSDWDGVGLASTISDFERTFMGQVTEPEEAELIVTLHRTIDAQLAILRFGVKRQQALDWTNRVRGALDLQSAAAELELALADAILGSDS